MTTRRRIAVFSFLAALLLVLTAVSAVGAASQRAFVGKLTLTGAQEVIGTGPTPSCAPLAVCGDPDAVGEAWVQIVPALDRVCVRVEWSGIDGTVWGAHIHGPADAQHAAGILVPLLMQPVGDPTTHLAGTDSFEACMDSASADAIAANPSLYYLNVHSTVFGPGAIRAQLAG